jgi:hypothetical protein
MIDALAILLVLSGVGLALFWAFSDQPQKAAGFSASLIAVLAGRRCSCADRSCGSPTRARARRARRLRTRTC